MEKNSRHARIDALSTPRDRNTGTRVAVVCGSRVPAPSALTEGQDRQPQPYAVSAVHGVGAGHWNGPPGHIREREGAANGYHRSVSGVAPG